MSLLKCLVIFKRVPYLFYLELEPCVDTPPLLNYSNLENYSSLVKWQTRKIIRDVNIMSLCKNIPTLCGDNVKYTHLYVPAPLTLISPCVKVDTFSTDSEQIGSCTLRLICRERIISFCHIPANGGY